MGADDLIKLERDEEGVATLTMCDERGRNALGERFVEQLVAALERLAADAGAKVCLLRGLEEVFCAGGDREMLLGLARGEIATTDVMVSRAVLEAPIPTIAAMEGHAVGGGLTLGLCCDVVLMARESSYGCSFMNMGFTPGMGTTRLLSAAVGDYVAAEMMYGGRLVRGAKLERRALVNDVLPRAEVLPRALKLARRIAEKPRPALELLKRYLSLDKRRLFEEARSIEAMMHDVCFAREETASLIEEYFERFDLEE